MEKTADVYRIINMFFVGQSGSEWVSAMTVITAFPYKHHPSAAKETPQHKVWRCSSSYLCLTQPSRRAVLHTHDYKPDSVTVIKLCMHCENTVYTSSTLGFGKALMTCWLDE